MKAQKTNTPAALDLVITGREYHLLSDASPERTGEVHPGLAFNIILELRSFRGILHGGLNLADKLFVGPSQATSALHSRKYITFRMGRQDFAIDASRVRAMLPPQELTPLRRSVVDTRPLLGAFGEAAWLEKWTCGFAALKGRAFPVIDLRAKLGVAPAYKGRQPCIVVVEVASRLGPQLAGFVADSLSEIVDARERDISRGKLRGKGRPRQILDADLLFAE